MKKRNQGMLTGMALAGLLAGTSATQARAMVLGGPSSGGATSFFADPGSMLSALSDAGSAKHDCKGMNACKGMGGCKTSDNGCKGKNSCKGKGGCSTNTPT